MYRNTFIVALATALALLAGACSRSATTTTPARPGHSAPSSATVDVGRVHGLGQILVTGSGHTLYMFPPDHGGTLTCIGACAGTWPPLKLAAHAVPHAGAGVRPDLLGTARDPAGGRVVTYNHWPLYTYVGDLTPGQATGQALDLNGAPWYVLRPSGAPLLSTGTP
jgi:predicted lipoprotein with Yx(FWY)xxD motif